MNSKLIEFLRSLTPYIISSILALMTWMWTFQKWRETVNLKILTNECYIIDSVIEDKKNLLRFKQSSLNANLYTNDLNKEDALDYYLIIQKETSKLIRDVDNLDTIYKAKCLFITNNR